MSMRAFLTQKAIIPAIVRSLPRSSPSNPYLRKNATDDCANFILDLGVEALLLNRYKRSLSGSLCVQPPTAAISFVSGYFFFISKNC